MRAVVGDGLQKDMVLALAPAMRAIASSMGPDGRHVIYASSGSGVGAARTGSEIARRICSDHFAERLLKEMLVDAERQFGDGTARLAVMAGAALCEALRAVAVSVPCARLVTGLEALRPELDAAFAAETRTCDDAATLLDGAGLTPDLRNLILAADAVAGGRGQIELREGAETTLLPGAGFECDVRTIGTAPLAAMESVHLIVANEILSELSSLAPVIEGFATHGKALVIVARGVEGKALQLIERNRQAGVVRMATLAPSDAGQRAAEILGDLAAACGASLICASNGRSIAELKPAMLGQADSFAVARGRLRLGGLSGRPADIALRLASAEAAIRANRYLPLDREHAERRRARLLGRWAEVTIARSAGSAARLEVARRAVAGVQAARAGGVICGGGLGLDRIADRLVRSDADQAMAAARALTMAALRAPGRCLRGNAGGKADEDRAQVDPARLSRDLLDVALSFALRLASLDRAVVRQ